MNKKRMISLLFAAMLLLSTLGGCAQNLPEQVTTEPSQYTAEVNGTTEATLQTDAQTDPTEESAQPTDEPTEATEETAAPTQPAQPTQPTTQSTEPVTQPTEPETQPTEAETQPTEPETQPTEAETQPSEPETQPTDPKPTGSAAIIDAAYALGNGQYLEGTHTLTGVITSIKTAYSDYYGNITVIISVPGSEDQPIQCFRLEGTGVDDLIPGDTVTVTGRLMNYRGTIEFDAGCHLDAVSRIERPETPTNPPSVNNDDSKEYVGWYIHTYGCLPSFYMTKSQAEAKYGWSGGPLDKLAPGMCIGGDRFTNYQKILPVKEGRYYTECDIDTIGASARGAKRIVFSNDGLVYYTSDHYESFTLLYGEP